jgi:chromate transporter
MLAFAFGHKLLTGKLGLGIVHGLQLVAVAVVAQAILSMRKSLAPDAPRTALALLATTIVFFASPATGTVFAIAAGALLGWLLPRSPQQPLHPLHFGVPKPAGVFAAASFLTLLFLLPIAALSSSRGAPGVAQSLAVFSAFYRTGALVFGGGHVVLPLLENAIVARGWVDQQSFLIGYGAAQAIPGPLFTFAAYLGATIQPTFNPAILSAVALVAIFLPGLLLVVAVLPFWNNLRERPQIQACLRGVNAAVVGLLIAAFIHPVWSSAVHSLFDLAVVLTAFALLVRWKLPPWILVVAVVSVSTIASVA